MTDVNSLQYHSTSSHIADESNRSFVLNESNIPMDIDDDEMLTENSTKINGHISPASTHSSENEQNQRDVFHQGNPMLNKSFDVLPQIKENNTPSIDPTPDHNDQHNGVLDTTVELPNSNDDFDEKSSHDDYPLESINHIDGSSSQATLLSNQFSLEYPYVVPQPIENVQSTSPEPIESVTSMTKGMKLNLNKTLEGQEPSTPTAMPDKGFDTNTFVLKKKERRKVATSVNDHSFNATSEETPPDLNTKQSPLTTPTGSFEAPRPTMTSLSQQQTAIDPTRIM